MINWFVKKVLGSKNQREMKRLWPVVEKINKLEVEYQGLLDEQLIAKTTQFKERVGKGETLDQILPEAFAVVKNACRRLAGRKHMSLVRGQEVLWEMVPFDVQLIGGMVLHSGRITEMATGEGKTLVATFPAYLNALTGRGVHVVTVNDYLAARDSEWMGEVYRFLNLTVGCIQNGQSPEIRRLQYNCDITYGTSAEMGFDYLRDNGMATTRADQVQRGHSYAVVDEVDSILIDEARVPLIIAGPATISTHQFDKFKGDIERLVQAQGRESNRWAADAKKQTDDGKIPEAGRLLFKVKSSTPTNKQLLKMIEEPEMRRAMDDAELALYQDPRKTELYALKEEAFFSIDPKTNEADLSERGRTFLNPNDPNTFVLPDLITRFHDIDAHPDLAPEEKQRAKANEQANYDQASERIHNISQLLRAYCVYEKDVQYVVQDNKVVIVDENTGRTMPGRRWSDGLHQAIEAKEGVQIERENQTLATITIQNYFRLYQKLAGMTGTAETEANEFHDIYKLDVVVIPTNRPIARVDLDDIIYKTRREKYNAILKEIKGAHAKGQPLLVGTISVESSELLSRMLKREGIVHNVLNAKFVQQEAEIVAGAGQRGAVTIATNMAGRGTDIKLGSGVNKVQGLYIANAKQRVVETAGPDTKFDETVGEHFTSGLFVIGTERHESRRIDRQLRGRCARQGDPGVSKFFVSFEDDLMRNFADSRRLSGLMTKLGMKDDEELQHPWLNKSVESAQRRVEERNYVSRKHTLQYDDVMNQQRTVIYAWRNDVLTTETPRDEIFEVVQEVIETETEARLGSPEAIPAEYVAWLNSTFPVGVEEKDFDFSAGPEAVQKIALQRVRDSYAIKIKFEDPNALQSLERYTLLGAIDRLWQEHLYAIDSLRQGINLRAHAQRGDPLIDYKRDAYTMFSDLMGRIKLEIATSLFRTSASITAFESFLRNLPQKLIHETPPPTMSTPDPEQQQAPLSELPDGAEGGNGAPISTAPVERQLPIRHTGPQLARNDMCPLGTGKKFKYCCGAKGQTKVCTGEGAQKK
jgi:preprotein translocase subunit SecA